MKLADCAAKVRLSLKRWMIRSGQLTVLCIGATFAVDAIAALPAQAALELRVAIEQDVSSVTIGSSTAATLVDGSGQVLAEIPAMGALQAQYSNGRVQVNQWQAGQVWVEPTDGGYVFIGDKWYRGRTLVMPTSDGLTAVNYVDLEAYLYSVVGAEMPASWPLEALKAQAVAARTYALYQRQTGANTIFDVGDTTAWQVYEGIEQETASTQAAVSETSGQVLVYEGQLIEAVFHSSSGGHTENVEDIWTAARPYLRGVPDFDRSAPVYQWSESVSADQLESLAPGIGDLVSLAPVEQTPRGRIESLQLIGENGVEVVSGDEVRSALNLRSTLMTFVVQQYQDVASAEAPPTELNTLQVDGRGFGHGIGMSQWGAYELAQQGYNYQQIVMYYYTNSALAQIEVQ